MFEEEKEYYFRFSVLSMKFISLQENHAEMFLDIVGFRLEYSEKPVDWSNCTIVDFPKSM